MTIIAINWTDKNCKCRVIWLGFPQYIAMIDKVPALGAQCASSIWLPGVCGVIYLCLLSIHKLWDPPSHRFLLKRCLATITTVASYPGHVGRGKSSPMWPGNKTGNSFIHLTQPASYLHLNHKVCTNKLFMSPQHSWWGLVLVETCPAQWVTLHNIFLREMWFFDCKVIHHCINSHHT